MEELILPESVVEVGSGAFYKMTELKTLHLSSALTVIPENMCFGCSQLSDILIPESIKTIGDAAFQYCENLSDITIGNNVESIGSYSFSGTAIESIVVPDATSVIEDLAFADCYRLKTVTLGSGMSKIKPNAFAGDELETLECRAITPPTVFSETFTDWQFENTTLIVPDESLDAYGSKAYWKKFMNRIGAAVETIDGSLTSLAMRYDLNGRVVNDAHKGITIIRNSDGTTKKLIKH